MRGHAIPYYNENQERFLLRNNNVFLTPFLTHVKHLTKDQVYNKDSDGWGGDHVFQLI